MINAAFLGMIIPLVFLLIILRGENRLTMIFFAWGLISFVLSLGTNAWLTSKFALTFQQLSITWAPIVEEFFKSLPLLYFLVKIKNTQYFNQYSLIYFAMASGIGFSIQENYLYLFKMMGAEGSPAFYMVMRSITSCLMHGMTTAILGYGLTLIRSSKVMVGPLLFGLFSLSVTLHSLFNLYINSSILGVRLIAMLMPFMLYIMGLILLYEEKQTIPPAKHFS